MMTAERIADIEKAAREEGFRSGYAEGLSAGQQEIRQRAARLERLFDAMAEPLAGLDSRVEEELVELALAVARQLLRREIKTDPGQVMAVVREALAALPAAAGRIVVHLHPEDAEFLRETLPAVETERSWHLVADPSITRGGARLVTQTSHVEATLESRLNAVIAAIWGGERQRDTPSGGAKTS